MNKKKFFLVIISVILIFVLMAAFSFAAGKTVTELYAKHLESNLQKSITSVSDENSSCLTLEIPNTDVKYTIAHADSNNPDYYLNHDLNGDYSYFGTPYLACYCNTDSDNMIIYGHNISSKYVFGKLIKYKDYDYCKNHNIIYFTTDQKHKYEIISVMSINVYDFDYTFVTAQNKKDYDSFVDKVKSNSLYDCDTNAEYRKQLLTLSTCDNSRGKDYRLIIVAAEIKQE